MGIAGSFPENTAQGKLLLLTHHAGFHLGKLLQHRESGEPLEGSTQQEEIQARKVYCINRAIPTLPINLEGASCSEAEFEQLASCTSSAFSIFPILAAFSPFISMRLLTAGFRSTGCLFGS